MTAIRGSRARTSTQNGMPEQVPYVYGQQTRRNTYAGRMAQRSVDGWWLLPAALRAELSRPSLRAARTAREQSEASARARRTPAA